jgi:dTDP-4-dehydrorhamnose reductase
MKKALITGSSGMLGTALLAAMKDKFNCTGVDIQSPLSENFNFVECDLTDIEKLTKVFSDFLPDVVIHLAAIVNVDACESDIQTAISLHVESTRVLSKLSQENSSSFIYVSTDSVFNGQKKEPYLEEDSTAPLNIYSKTKLDGENIALEYNKALVLRTNIFGWTSSRKSFAEWVLDGLIHSKKLNMFTDVLYTPISIYCLSDLIIKCIEKDVYGLYHASSQTVLSKYDFAMLLAAEYQLSSDSINPVSKEDVKLDAVRPANMALNSKKLSKRLGFAMPDVSQSIRRWKENQPHGGSYA